MKTEYDLDKMKRREKVRVTKDLKVQKTIRLDAGVLSWLQDKAEEEGIGYQTFLNSFLKKAMRSENDKFEEIFKRIKNLENKVG